MRLPRMRRRIPSIVETTLRTCGSYSHRFAGIQPRQPFRNRLTTSRCPGIELGGGHRLAENHRAPLRPRDHHVQEQLRGKDRGIQGEALRARLALQHPRDELDGILRAGLFGHDGRQLRESGRLRDNQPVQSEGRRGKRAAQDQSRQPLQDLLQVRPVEQRHIGRRAQTGDGAMDHGAEERRFVVEAVIERPLRNARPFGHGLDRGGAVAGREEQRRCGVENPFAQLLRFGPRRTTAAAQGGNSVAVAFARGRGAGGLDRERIIRRGAYRRLSYCPWGEPSVRGGLPL